MSLNKAMLKHFYVTLINLGKVQTVCHHLRFEQAPQKKLF